ncbi:DUF1996 domain-containing protein [Parasphingorhabdus sp.]
MNTPYDEIAKTPMAGATKEQAHDLRREGELLIKAGNNYIDGGMRRLDLARELLACPKTGEEPCECPPDEGNEDDPGHEHPDHPAPEGTFIKHPLPTIASNFDTQPLYEPRSEAPKNSSDVVGAFRMNVPSSHLLFDDPIVYPGQPGKAHLHEFFGNFGADAFSTYESLRTTGDSNAMNRLNRSSYWLPALFYDDHHVLRGDYGTVYYKQRPSDDPIIEQWGAEPIQMPNGLRFIVGHTMNGGPVTGKPYVKANVGGTYPDLEALLAEVPRDQITALYFAVTGPSLWDGENLDSPDHRSHVGNLEFGAHTDWKQKAVAPINTLIPQITFIRKHTILPEDDMSQFRLSSDEMAGTPRGGSMHMDFFEAWDEDAKNALISGAINDFRNCSNGDFGNGTGMKHDHWNNKAEPRLVPIPERG